MARSGQITVTTAGTAVQGTDQAGNLFAIKAHPDNTDTVWVGNDETASPDVTSSNGFPLGSADAAILLFVSNLNALWFDSDVSGEKFCWVKIN